jgi:hypothetical protein
MFPDPNDNIIQLSDRIKELSYTVGTNNMVLENAAPGFSRFGDFYQQSGLVFYAITDGAEYEVGSGHYLSSTLEPFYSSDQLRRYPFRSTNNNTKVDWAAGTKEVFVTYPAPFTVMTAHGVDDRFNQPERSGIAFWDNEGAASGTNILNYDSSGNWDKDNHRLGLHTFSPGYAIDVEGPSSYSIVKASGLRLDSSGIIFSGGYDGHGQYSTRQLDPFLMNQVDAITGSNAVIDVSGWVNESIVLKTQAAGQVFSGPLNDCVGGCDDGYPAFRVLHTSDIPDLSSLYLTGYNLPPETMSGIAFFRSSGVLTYDPGFVWDDTLNALGINHARPTAALDVVGAARISHNLVVGNNLTVSGNLDVAGTTTYIDSTNVTIWDKQLELASMSGNATHDQLDSYIDDGGVVVRSSGDGDSDTGDKKWTWQNSSNTWKAQTSNGVPIGVTASGMVFGNGTAISGAYQGGSGISINGFNLDIGNLFSVSGNDDAAYGWSTQNVHQADNIVISGVSGVTSWITTSGTKTTIHIDPSFLSGVLQTQITANETTATLHRFPYASGVAHSGFFSEELHEVSGVGGLMAANSGALQYQLDNMGSVGEVNQSAFSIVAISGASPSTWHSTISSDTKTDTLVIDSGHDNSISIIPDFDNDRFVISGAHQFRLGADNTPSLSSVASGYIGHNDGITISGGYGLNTSHAAGAVTVDWSGGNNLFGLRADSDGATATNSTISSDGPSVIDISGGSYITTTRIVSPTGNKVVVAWSGSDNTYDWLTDPGSLSSLTSAASDAADEMIIWDDTAGAWKKFTVAEMTTKFSSGSGGSQNLYHTITVDNTDSEYTWDDTSFTPGGTTESLEFVSRNDDLYLSADATTKSVGFGLHNTGSGIAVAISGQFVESGVLQSGILQTQISTKAHGVDLTQVSGTLDQRISDSGVAVSGYAMYKVAEASGALDLRISDSGVAVSGYAMYKVAEASGALDQRISDSGVAVSGFCTVYTGSGVDVYAHSTGVDSRTLNINPDWYRKDRGSSSTYTAYTQELQEAIKSIIIGKFAEADPKVDSIGSVVIGNYAGGGFNNSESNKNTAVGFKAGYSLGAGRSEFNSFLGSKAGEGLVTVAAHSDIQVGNICIGDSAGAGRTGSSEGNIFVGRYSGSRPTSHISKGSYNITIGSFPYNGSTTDAVNSQSSSATPIMEHDYNLNIANLITADYSVGSTYSKRVKIGDISAGTVQPQGTLELKAINTSTTTFFISRATSQSSPLMQTQTPEYNYNDGTAKTTNSIIGNEGFLRIPQFENKTALKAVAPADHPGMLAMYYTCAGNSQQDWLMVFSDGTQWKSVGDVQRSVMGSVFDWC